MFRYIMMCISLVTFMREILLYVKCVSLSCFFYCRFEVENNKRITVQDYFTRIKGVQLQSLHLPCLDVGSPNRKVPIYLPPEVRKFFFLTVE